MSGVVRAGDSLELTLADAARKIRDAKRDNSYRATPIGEDVGRFLRYMQSQDLALTSRREYESILYRFALDHADLALVDFVPPVGVERIEEWVEDNWGDKAPGTRRKAIAIMSSFFRWAYERGRVSANPMPLIKPPKKRQVDRRAHSPHKIFDIVRAQPLLRDRCALLLLAKLGLRKNELRLVRIKDLELGEGLIRLEQKGGDVVYHPIVFEDVVQALAEHFTLDGRQLEEYLLYPRWERKLKTGEVIVQREERGRPLSQRGMHEWFGRCLVRAGLAHFPMHELRHTAGTEFHRAVGDLELTRKFMRHKSIQTTSSVYMHLDQDDLATAMRRAQERWKANESG